MEVWRPEVIEGRRPEVLSGLNFGIALAIHLAAFLTGWLFAVFHPKEQQEVIVPIDMTVVVNENLQGKENEPPPVLNPPPPVRNQPRPRPKDEPKRQEPKPLEQIEVKPPEPKKTPPKKVPPKKDPPKKDPPPQKKPPKPDPPKKTAKEIQEEKIRRIRGEVVKNKPVRIEVKNAKQSGDGRTERQPRSQAEIEKLLLGGARPGSTNQLAVNEKQRCLSLISRAIEEKWDQLSPTHGSLGLVTLSFTLNSSGGLENVRVVASCGDRLTDEAARMVASRVTAVAGLSPTFIAEARKQHCTIKFNAR